ncbi:TonB-dependent receptor domain-containing protein (plasmid) [Microbulbifer sp. SSSA002]|uniref:TonB-dependent receptor domain-containing protein n=1 Tax=Microbulbifer sp. SSSA002 TaxID=3243376 RepID=UPI0040399127
MLNYELGAKGNWLDNRLQAQSAAFYQDRSDVQAKQSLFNPESKKFRGNAAGGETYGFEAEINFQATDTVRLFASAGWLMLSLKTL